MDEVASDNDWFDWFDWWFYRFGGRYGGKCETCGSKVPHLFSANLRSRHCLECAVELAEIDGMLRACLDIVPIDDKPGSMRRKACRSCGSTFIDRSAKAIAKTCSPTCRVRYFRSRSKK